MDTTTKASRIAANVRRARADRDISIRALSESTGIPYSTLKSHMRGRGEFTGTEILLLCDALDVDPQELLGVASDAARRANAGASEGGHPGATPGIAKVAS